MNSKLTWWFKIVHGIAGIWWRRRLCMEKKKWVHEEKKGKTRERSKLYDKICHFSGGKDLCLSAPPGEAGWEAGWAAIAFHWQADKQGGGRLAPEGPLSASRTNWDTGLFWPGTPSKRAHSIERARARPYTQRPWKNFTVERLEDCKALCTSEMPSMKGLNSRKALLLFGKRIFEVPKIK